VRISMRRGDVAIAAVATAVVGVLMMGFDCERGGEEGPPPAPARTAQDARAEAPRDAQDAPDVRPPSKAPEPEGPPKGSKICERDTDCFLDRSCLGCNRCYRRSPVGTGDIDCAAECSPDISLACMCVDGQCAVTKASEVRGPRGKRGR
jgi:hypothetical protein